MSDELDELSIARMNKQLAGIGVDLNSDIHAQLSGVLLSRSSQILIDTQRELDYQRGVAATLGETVIKYGNEIKELKEKLDKYYCSEKSS